MQQKATILSLVCLSWIGFIFWTLGINQQSCALAIAGIALVLWLSESVAAFVPTFVLIAGILGIHTFFPSSGAQSTDPAREIFRKMADPVLGLFFCGMCLGLVLRKHGVDHFVAQWVNRLSGGSPIKNLRISMLATAGFAMWTTNTTAMAICLPAFGKTIQKLESEHPRQAKGLLIALALAANFGGMITPIGTAPNAIAIAAVANTAQISFALWMAVMLPLAALMLVATEMLVRGFFSFGKQRNYSGPIIAESHSESAKVTLHVGSSILFAVTVLLWLTEPIHGIHPLAVGFGAAGVAFGTGMLGREDLAKIDWDVLLLIAGGLLLGNLLEQAGVLERFSLAIQSQHLSLQLQLGIIVLLAAVGSAVSSNTATAVLLIPVALKIAPESPAAAAIAVAAGCSLGVPFTISTPANALIAGRHGVGNKDLAKVGLPLMIGGCVFVAATAEWFIRLVIKI
jgi:sodium-dependent dicarboxylate transporter 2/3/5